MLTITSTLKADIFALYKGCQIYEGETDKHSLVYSICTWEKVASMATSFIDISQLILIPLEEITQEHILKAFEIVGLEPYISDEDVQRDYFLKTFSPYRVSRSDDRYGPAIYYAMHDYLRSLGYMLPAYGIDNLFEAGIAIVKPKK